MDLHVGTSGYSYKPWKGSFYPKALPDKQMLRYYGGQFSTVEINSTFYGVPKITTLENWAGDVPDEFRFVIKAPKQISHGRKLDGVGDLVTNLVEVAEVLADRLGPLLFQLPPYAKKDAAGLRALLGWLPPQVRAAFEFRHPSWFDDEILGLLRDHNAALCLADAEDDLEVPFISTADWGYLRLRRPDYDDAGLKDWAKRVQDQNWREAFVFFKHEDEAKGPRMAKQFLEMAAAA